MKYSIYERKDPSQGMPAIELENGLLFVVENIKLDEDNPVLSYDYTLLCDPVFPQEEYEKMIGDWVVHVLTCAMEDNTLDKML